MSMRAMKIWLCSEREIMMFNYVSANGKLKREGGALQMLLRLNYDDDDHLINEISVVPSSSLDTWTPTNRNVGWNFLTKRKLLLSQSLIRSSIYFIFIYFLWIGSTLFLTSRFYDCFCDEISKLKTLNNFHRNSYFDIYLRFECR